MYCHSVSATQSGQTIKRNKGYDIEANITTVMAAFARWEKRANEARCPRCGVRNGKVVNEVVIQKNLHCRKCRAVWLSRR